MKTDNHVLDLLPDFLSGTFDESDRNAIQTHLQSCSSCRHEFESLSTLWESMGTLPDERPGPQVRVRFRAMLAAYEQGVRHASTRTSVFHALDNVVGTIWPRRPVIQFGIACLMLIVGGVAGSRWGRTDAPKEPETTTTEIARLHGEVQAIRGMLAVSLMQQQSASDRLKGITMSTRFVENNPQILQNLLDALRYDPSVNVRLAALDALSGAMNESEVRKTLVDALPKQTSPLVQLAMVELVVESRDKGSLPVLSKMKNDPNVNKVVRAKIQQGILQLL